MRIIKTIPKTILYIAKTFIGFFFKNAINLSITTRATIKDTINPAAKAINSIEEHVLNTLCFINDIPDAPIIAGIAKRMKILLLLL